jgi:crotonobetainyl-CoA:carnitine CoA-transferase CaiB-like acyl-CoA transferase
VDAALNVAAEQVIEYSAYGALLQRDGNRGPCAAPQNLYLTTDIDEFGRQDCWVAVAVATDEQWTGLCRALGQRAWAGDPTLTTMAGRRAQQDSIDARLAAWCAGRSGDEVVSALWEAGVPVAKVMQPHRQTELAQLSARGFFEKVGHPVNAPSSHSTLPFTVPGADGARVHRNPAPLLGEHNHELLTELGLTVSEIAALEDEGVIGTAPAMYGSAKSKAARSK